MVLFSSAFLIAIYLRGRKRDRIVAGISGVPEGIAEIKELMPEEKADKQVPDNGNRCPRKGSGVIRRSGTGWTGQRAE